MMGNVFKVILLLMMTAACNEMKAKKEATKPDTKSVLIEQKKLKAEILKIQKQLELQKTNTENLDSKIIELEGELKRTVEQFILNIKKQFSEMNIDFGEAPLRKDLNPFELKRLINSNFKKLQEQIQDLKDTNLDHDKISKLEVRLENFNKEKNEQISELKLKWEEDLNNLSARINDLQINEGEKEKLVEEIEKRLLKSSSELQLQIETGTSLSQNEAVSLQEELKEIRHISEKLLGSNKAYSVVSSLFEPCKEGLKDLDNCYTIGNTIIQLGGSFLDPTYFDRNIKSLLEYFSASGLKSEIFFEENLYKNFLYPSPDNQDVLMTCYESGEEVLQAFNPDDLALIPPQKFWVRGVVIGLIVERLEGILADLKKANVIEENVQAISQINSWWRSDCYDKAINNKTQSKSDHLDASAMDLQFPNQAAGLYYFNFVKKHFWDSDFFKIRSALSFEKESYSLGLGIHESFLHLSIGANKNKSENFDRRIWSYDTSISFNISDFLAL